MTYPPTKWYHVPWVLKDGTNKVEPDRQMLFLNDKLVGTAPGGSMQVEYMPPRFGRSHEFFHNGRTLTRFPDQDAINELKPKDRPMPSVFQGRVSDFVFANEAILPEKK